MRVTLTERRRGKSGPDQRPYPEILSDLLDRRTQTYLELHQPDVIPDPNPR
jgi:hypothetical protein